MNLTSTVEGLTSSGQGGLEKIEEEIHALRNEVGGDEETLSENIIIIDPA